ncbi:hypothetical protein RRG08_050165 [Elysia crispata]|uniref:Uncharacterized protein n=1 Tax=Elysia crispata TaxID=231223 RepID=A0AAE0YDF9_9GAST|nr:hypothetical protein RRG08_050165 [Elysia crispata]
MPRYLGTWKHLSPGTARQRHIGRPGRDLAVSSGLVVSFDDRPDLWTLADHCPACAETRQAACPRLVYQIDSGLPRTGHVRLIQMSQASQSLSGCQELRFMTSYHTSWTGAVWPLCPVYCDESDGQLVRDKGLPSALLPLPSSRKEQR